jgi:hypothetical protein
MEVHPPEHGIHSWRDFFVHMGTITLGLLIAIGLEQSLEAWHRREELHTLREDLRVEGEQNLKRSEASLPWVQRQLQYSLITVDRIHRAIDAHEPLPVELDGIHGQVDLPVDPVWSAATQGHLVEIMPREDTQVYAELDHLTKALAEDEKVAYPKDWVAFLIRRGQDYAQFRTSPDLQMEYLKLMSSQCAAMYSLSQDLSALNEAEKASLEGKPLDKILEAEHHVTKSVRLPTPKALERPTDPHESMWLSHPAAIARANFTGAYVTDGLDAASSKPSLTIRQTATSIHIERSYDYGRSIIDTKLDGSTAPYSTPDGFTGTAQARMEGDVLIVRLETLHSAMDGDYYEYTTRRYQLTPDKKQLKVHIDHLYPPMADEKLREKPTEQTFLHKSQ